MTEPESSFDTLAVHAGQEPDELTGAVAPPIYQTSTYAQDAVGQPRRGYEYARTQNPTRERLERALATLEGGRHGIAFASGSAATTTIAELVAPGEEVVIGDDVYGGTFRFFDKVARSRGLRARFVDLAGESGAAVAAVLTEETRMVWFETPTNPHLKVVDIAAVASAAQAHIGARGRPPLVVVDNTFASPALQRPIEHGADIVVHSSTKYLGGHSDTINGVAVTNGDEIADRLRFLQNAIGAVPGPLDCFLVLRGLRTLALRMERHTRNAEAVAAFLAARADVEWVAYPGLGGMVSFIPGATDGASSQDRAVRIAEATRIFTLAESLGGVESLIEVPSVMTHASVAESPLEVEPGLIRLSVGIEAADDLIADLRQAFDQA